MKHPKLDPQKYCITYADAIKQMEVLNQQGLKVKYFKILVVGSDCGKLTLTFDPVKFNKQKTNQCPT